MTTKYIVNNVTGQTINGQSVLPNYKVYTALLSQSGPPSSGWFESFDNGALPIGWTVQISDYQAGDDFTNIGAPSNANGVSFVINGNTATSWTGLTRLNYNTGAPTVTVLENTIGNVWFTYNDVGTYYMHSDNLFVNFKTTAIMLPEIYIEAPEAITNYQCFHSGNDSMIVINTFNNDVLQDGRFNSFAQNAIEIRVYN